MNLAKTTEEIFNNFIKLYWCDEQSLLREYYPICPEKPEYSYLWGYGALLTTVCSVIDATENNAYLPLAKKCFNGLNQYLAERKDYRVYNSAPKIQGYGEPFYDDNAWVALALIQMNEIAKDGEYLEKAKEIAEYLLKGKNPIVGGIYWKENECNSSNTCSSAPTVVTLLKLYQVTKEKRYLTEAETIYRWVKEKLIDTNGIYFDSLDNDNKVCTWQFSYNTGVMIWAGILLFEITGQACYLEDAIYSKREAEQFFLKRDENSKIMMLPKMPWFNVYLLQGFIAAESYDEKSSFTSVLNCAEYAFANARTEDGLFLNDWAQSPNACEKPFYSINLDTLGSVECFALLLKWQSARRKRGKHD